MDGVGGRFSSTLKIALGALGVTGGMLLLALVFGAHSASADTPNTPPSPAAQPGTSAPATTPPGLLGTVGSTLTGVTAPVTGAVASVPSLTSAVVAPVVETVTAAVPTPVRQLAQPIAQAVESTTSSVSVSGVLTPVTDTVDGVVSSVPVLGDTLHSTLGSLSSVTTPLVGTVDGVVSTVGATTTSVTTEPAASVTVSAPAPADFASSGSADGAQPSGGAEASDAVTVSPASTPFGDDVLGIADVLGTTSSSNSSAPSSPVPAAPTAPRAATGQPSTLRGGGGSPGATALSGVLGLSRPTMLASHSVANAGDDDIPSTPTYDTDTSPD